MADLFRQFLTGVSARGGYCLVHHRVGRSTTGASGTKTPTNGIGANARIAGRGTRVKKVGLSTGTRQARTLLDAVRAG